MSRTRHLLLIIALMASAVPGAAHAAGSACPEHHAGGAAPDITRPQLATETRELCFREYSITYSGISRTPLAAAEHLTRERVEDARGLRRENAFHEEAADGRTTMSFKPYADEATALQIGELSVENRLDRVALFGSLDLTRDKIGLQHARALRDLLATVVTELEREGTALPETTETASIDTVKNPFG